MTGSRRSTLTIGGNVVPSGKWARFELPIARLMSGTPVALPIVVGRGLGEGPTIWLSAAVHGDEIAGVEIIRRVLRDLDPRELHGTVIAVPVVNVHGFNTGDRYLPDRRDLNRSFPGSSRGSLAARIANLLMKEVVERCTVGIDLHTGSGLRTNLPQIRGNLDDPTTLELAGAFAAPVTVHSRVRDGSLRQAATEVGCKALVFEGGEASRFDEHTMTVGTDGVKRVMAALSMIPDGPLAPNGSLVSRHSRWLRAPRSGILHLRADLGMAVSAGDVIARIRDPFGKQLAKITAKEDGLVIGRTQHPLVNQGDAVLHLARIEPS